MLLALRNRLASLMLAAALIGASIPSSSESQSLRLAAARDASRSAPSADPARTALLALGSDGQAIFQARAEVLSLLSQTNACSAWFLSAEPQAAEKFRSMDFALDPSGSREIIQFASWREQSGYYQPYVAKTGQNVGWGSTITLNANGAFFKTNARVRILGVAGDPGRLTASRPLAIGPFSAATLPARILAMLHEFGHTLDLLPVDSGVAGGPAISVQNTETVVRHCGAEIRSRKKPSRAIGSQPVILSASALKTFDSPAVKPKSLGENLP